MSRKRRGAADRRSVRLMLRVSPSSIACDISSTGPRSVVAGGVALSASMSPPAAAVSCTLPLAPAHDLAAREIVGLRRLLSRRPLLAPEGVFRGLVGVAHLETRDLVARERELDRLVGVERLALAL